MQVFQHRFPHPRSHPFLLSIWRRCVVGNCVLCFNFAQSLKSFFFSRFLFLLVFLLWHRFVSLLAFIKRDVLPFRAVASSGWLSRNCIPSLFARRVLDVCVLSRENLGAGSQPPHWCARVEVAEERPLALGWVAWIENTVGRQCKCCSLCPSWQVVFASWGC